MKNLKLADIAMAAKRQNKTPWKCAGCGIEKQVCTSHERRLKYCSKSCGAKVNCRGRSNPNFKNLEPMACLRCGINFRTYEKGRKFCSHACYSAFYATEEGRKLRSPYRGGMKDRNHNDMVALFESMGCSVLETHTVGGGFPDMVLGLVGENVLVEIKNPETAYGRKGLSDSQRAMSDSWRGSEVHVVSNQEDAIKLVQRVRERISRGIR